MIKQKNSNIVVIGGGTGTFTVLNGLKEYPVHLSAIISMMDSGGSNRILRDEFGILPTSDIRQCIVALSTSEANETLRSLFTYRYSQGTGITGMTFGNLFMAALTDIYGSQKQAIEETCKLLNVKGDIIPVTYDQSHLVARYENGVQVLGEHYIDEPSMENGQHAISELSLIPEPKVNEDAVNTILNADLIVLGPGDLFTSTICNLVIPEIADALQKTKGKVLYIMNLMTKFGQTNNFTAANHLEKLQYYLGQKTIDYCLVNKDTKYSRQTMRRYQSEHSIPVMDDLSNVHNGTKVIREKVSSNVIHSKQKADHLVRSLIRHDSNRLAKAIMTLV